MGGYFGPLENSVQDLCIIRFQHKFFYFYGSYLRIFGFRALYFSDRTDKKISLFAKQSEEGLTTCGHHGRSCVM